jgi:ABC-type transport system involved in cytochrome c biogenesis permease subunit
MRALIACCLLLLAAVAGAENATDRLPTEADAIPVLHQGRVKPLAVAAEEIVYAITGYGRFGEVREVGGRLEKGATMPPVELLLRLMAAPEAWRERPLLYVPYLPLQQQLGLSGQWASPKQAADARPLISAAVMKKQRAEQTHERVALDHLEEDEYALAEREQEASAALDGSALALMPLAPDATGRAWALAKLVPALGDPAPGEAPFRARLREIAARPEAERDQALRGADIWLTFADLLRDDPLLTHVDDSQLEVSLAPAREFVAAFREALRPESGKHGSVTGEQALRLAAAVREQASRRGEEAVYPSATKLSAELAYQRMHPFSMAWVCYILGGIITAIGLGRRRAGGSGKVYALGVALTLLGLAFNAYGLGARVYITSLGAVTNLYETLVYVALLCAALGLIFASTTKNGLYAVAGGVAAGLCAMVGEALPPDLGSHIGQLQPVLRSKFWLWTHVKTVVASYAAFMLALVIGNIVLIRAALERRAVSRDESGAIYRSLQVGVVLIAAGTLLGAVWADQAWGRFWGWDPKEVWALVILLTYLIPLHLRYVGAVGPTGLAAWSIYGFMSVIMSWYGVNFLLGTGLHAYAFGSGGKMWVLPLCGVQIVVATVALVTVMRATKGQKEPDLARLPLEATGQPES